MNEMKSLADIDNIQIAEDRKLFSATHDEIVNGLTTDVYFLRTLDILNALELADAEVIAEIFPRKPGVFVGIAEVLALLEGKNLQIDAISEGESFAEKDTVIRIKGKYSDFAIFETTILGMLASSSGWATASREVKEACGDKFFLCFGARHVHPAVAPVMERAAVIGGAGGASCILAALLSDIKPSGTVPHSAMLIAGDTLTVAKKYDEIAAPEHNRIVLVDTFKDEVEEAIRIARGLNGKLYGIRLDTPSERGGVTVGLVKEMRAKLDLEGFKDVKIFVSGGLYPEKIKLLSAAGADSFGVGSYISAASPIDMTMDIKMVNGKAVAKRGRIPGMVENPKLKRIRDFK
ncbi:nicotinate phosphoribosyltransferase [Fusibacter sp. 3D3]|uniref:nicotinate phosphoribosyltransferase n=1 Tax=Fusibacter sp. 3D3 TaxID=1048380 RepID=UPI000853644B|nr:nicotinate phosphoribosyltransferase [Fusibacter sp. 3D3]GAU77401.1 nicotinate phosphoribosyltransferase [Fusibacter sp. 3D3]